MIIKSVSGIRGIVGDGLDPSVVLNYAAHFGEFLEGGEVIVGRDSRISGETLKNAVFAGLMGVGVDVIDVGVVPTPTLLYNVKTSNASGGIVITASHNPTQWNALKLVSAEGEFLDQDKAREFFSYEEKPVIWHEWDGLGKRRENSEAIENHIKGVLGNGFINPVEISRRRFTVVVDCVNGAASRAYPEFLKRLNCAVYPIFCDGTGEFLREPEPGVKSLIELMEKVKEVKADIGFATDPDGDRLSIVSDKGDALGEENTIVLAVDAILKKEKGPVVVNLSTTRAVEDIAGRAGVSFFRSPVGEANVVSWMKDKNAIIGGEGNGGVIIPTLQYTRDAMGAMALILQYLTERDTSLSHLMNTIPQYRIVKHTVKLKDEEKRNKFVERVKNANKDKKLDLRDGVRIETNDSWVHIRMSGTEPVVRVIAEAPTLKGARRLCDIVEQQGRN
ncbi:phosphoglucosamine mutase [candidate division WOR-3 bacterium]|nr:phosphoglucosamine mutase [candidate division WOR-3 bacterium]